MYSRAGLGFVFPILPIVLAAASAGASAGAARLLGPKPPGPPSAAELQAMELRRQAEFKEKVILLGAGAIVVIFVVMAVKR